MNVLLINGSPNREGCTYTALSEVAAALEESGISTEIFHIGNKAIHGCIACGKCREGSSRCVFKDDPVNEAIEKAKDADGFVFGSPVYYASANGAMSAFLDRFFFTGHGYCVYKPGASVVSARRAGTTAAYDQLNKYIGISNMLMVPAPYWNMVHGYTPEDVRKDEEGLYIMRSLGKNMAWMLKMLELGRANGLERPEAVEPARTNFIR